MRKLYSTLLLCCALQICGAQIRDAQINIFPIPTLSTSYIRMPSRAASQEMDAIYNNPAGVLSLRNGFHLRFENMFQWVDQNLESKGFNSLQTDIQNYPLKVKQYAFPLLYLAYRKNKWALSFMITPAIGGGGASKVSNLPFGEYPIADLTMLSRDFIKIMVDRPHGTNYSDINYSYDFDFQGLAFSPTIQMNLGYQINKYLGVSAGVRGTYYITTAKGGLQNLRFNNETLGISLSPGDYIRNMVKEVPVNYPELGNLLASAVDAFPLELEIDASQTDIGLAPVFGVNFNWNNRWYIAMKYEHRMPITLTTRVTDGKNGGGAYVDGKKVRSDVPAVFGSGVTFTPNDRLMLTLSNRLIFFRQANLDGREKFVNSLYKEFATGFEYKVMPRLKVSSGISYKYTGIEPEYYTSVDYFVPSVTAGLGFKTELSNRIGIEMGFLYSRYLDARYSQQVKPFGGLAAVALGQDLPDIINDNFSRKVEYKMTGNVYIASLAVDFWMGSIEENRKGRNNRIVEVRKERKANLERRVQRRDNRPKATKRFNKRQNRKRSEIRYERRDRRIERYQKKLDKVIQQNEEKKDKD